VADGLLCDLDGGRSGRARQDGAVGRFLELEELLASAGCPALKRAGHALWHTFASDYIIAGGNILAPQKILGHSGVKLTLVSAHLVPHFIGDEMERVGYSNPRGN